MATRAIMKRFCFSSALAIGIWARISFAAQPLPPNADGTFKTATYVYSVEGGTNSFYRIHDPPLPRETLPAEDDPESAWGPVSGGLQLCLRFEKEEFQIGERIFASIIVRNVSDRIVGDAVGFAGSVQFFVAGEKGQDVTPREAPPTVIKRNMFDLWQRTQYTLRFPLSELFALDRPGLYTVSAHKQVGPRSAPNVIMSGIATIRIVASKTTDGSDTNRTLTSRTTSSASASSQPSRIIEGPTGQPDGTPSELTGTNATAQRNQRVSNTSRNDGQSDSPPSRSEAGGTQLGFASGTLRIAASVLLLLVTAALVYILLRRARRTWYSLQVKLT